MAGKSDFDPSKPLLFVAMPFGEKNEPGGSRRIDFDALYEHCVQPAAEAGAVEVIRADEETLGGFIHKPMYERLLLAEIVIADLTFANANVFYELGVRHAARPRSTILIYADIGTALPFDVAPVRAISYEIEDDGLIVDANDLIQNLTERIAEAREGEAVDSPLFQLLEDYPGIELAHNVTDAFKARAHFVSDLTVRAHEAARPNGDHSEARAELREVESAALGLPETEEQLLVSLLLAYRDIEGWDEMVGLVEKMPPALQEVATVREQLALALNRRNASGDRRSAIEVIKGVIAEQGRSSESQGILGRCLKDRWSEKVSAKDPGAGDALDQAIDSYADGFEADPRDFYPGINLVTLLVCRGGEGDIERAQSMVPLVDFAVGRKGGIGSGDYWTLASVLLLAVIKGDETLGRRALSAMFDTEPQEWMRRTSAADLRRLQPQMAKRDVDEAAWIETAADELEYDKAGST